MARTVTLSVLRDEIRFLADAQGTSAIARHGNTDLNRAINQSIQRFREKVSNHGFRHYLVHATGSLTPGATSPHSFGQLDLSALSPSVVRVYRMTIMVNGRPKRLESVDLDNADDFFGDVATGVPEAFATFRDKVAVMPAPNAAYVYVIWYLPVLADLSLDADVFDGVAGWEAWVQWDVLTKLIQRDTSPALYQMAATERDLVWADIEKGANPVGGQKPVRRIDVRGLRASGRTSRFREDL